MILGGRLKAVCVMAPNRFGGREVSYRVVTHVLHLYSDNAQVILSGRVVGCGEESSRVCASCRKASYRAGAGHWKGSHGVGFVVSHVLHLYLDTYTV